MRKIGKNQAPRGAQRRKKMPQGPRTVEVEIQEYGFEGCIPSSDALSVSVRNVKGAKETFRVDVSEPLKAGADQGFALLLSGLNGLSAESGLHFDGLSEAELRALPGKIAQILQIGIEQAGKAGFFTRQREVRPRTERKQFKLALAS